MVSPQMRSRAVLAALGAAVAVSAALGAAPAAVADPGNTTACQPGQIVIDGQCTAAPPSQSPSDHSSDNGHK